MYKSFIGFGEGVLQRMPSPFYFVYNLNYNIVALHGQLGF